MITVLESCDYVDQNPHTKDYYNVYGKDIFLTKRIYDNNNAIPASMAKKFRLKSSRDIANLKDLFPLLRRLETNPHACIIRYAYHSANVGDMVLRRASELVATPRTIISIDIDELDLPEGISNTNIRAQAEYVMQLLHETYPLFFNKGTGVIAQGSSSAGLGNKVKLHLWVQNKSPLTPQQIKNAMYYVNRAYGDKLIDLALYSVGQIHYTATPLFLGKIQDPFRKQDRSVYIPGDVTHVPQSFPEWVAPVLANEGEKQEYLESIEGSYTPNARVETLLSTVLGWKPEEPGLRTKVVALYHNAIQSQYCLQTLEKQILPSLAVTRPGKGEAYIKEAKQAAMNFIKACSGRTLDKEVRGLPVTSLSGGSHERFLELDAFPAGHAIFLKASLGTGKTATIERMLRNKKIKGTFLAITDTSALVEANCIRFDAGDFRDEQEIDAFKRRETHRLSGTIHSLHRVKELNRKFDFIFIDEADSVLNTLLFASIITEPRRLVLMEALASILQKCDRIVFSDGDLSQETIQCYVDLLQGCKPIAKVEHIRKNLDGVCAYRHKSKESIWGAVDAALAVGDKCIVVTDNGPDRLNIYQDCLKRRYPEFLTVVAHAQSKMEGITRDVVNRTTEALKEHNVRCLICSPSITSGVDFNYFDTVFVITSTDVHSPNMRFQALMRERRPKEVHYFIAPTVRGFDTGYSNTTVDTDWINSSRKTIAARKEREYKVYAATFNYYLVKAGCTIKYVNEPYSCPLSTEDEEKYFEEKATAIVLNKPSPRFSVNRKLIETLLGKEDLQFDEVLAYVKDPLDKKLELFHNVANEFWDVISCNSASTLDQALSGPRAHKFYLLTGMSVKAHPPRKMLERMGVYENTNMLEYAETYKRYCLTMHLPIAEAVNKMDIADLGAS